MKIKYLLLLLIIIFVAGCNKREQVWTKDFFYMDTYINVKIYSNNDKLVDTAFQEIDSIYNEYHKLTDRYNPYAGFVNVHFVNKESNVNKSIEIDQRLYDMLKYAIDFYDQSDGLINIALGNVIDVWREYKSEGVSLPTVESLLESGSTKIDDILLEENYKIKRKSNVLIDLGAISKGYTTEIVGNYLEDIGLHKYLINAGGNVKVGEHYANSKYKIGVEDPNDNTKIYKVISANNQSIVSSGGYERFFEYEGIKYHHVIDPYTLFPGRHMLAVTVITRDSAFADALSTTLFLMPIEDGIAKVNLLDGVEAMWYGTNDEIYYSEGYDKYE